MAIEIQLERMRVVEAITARDAVVQRLTDAHVSIRQKNAAIDRLELERDQLNRGLPVLSGPGDEENEEKLKVGSEIERLQGIINSLQEELRLLKCIRPDAGKSTSDPPPRYEEGKADSIKVRYVLYFRCVWAHRAYM